MQNVDFGCKNVIYNEPMSRHTTFKIGGNADVMLVPETVEELISCLDSVKKHNIPCLL